METTPGSRFIVFIALMMFLVNGILLIRLNAGCKQRSFRLFVGFVGTK
ncbi:MAG: hypothetical protein NC206_00115 [Bacteroides sp.]|nr:hypothetical protein [Bacteroides sp.]